VKGRAEVEASTEQPRESLGRGTEGISFAYMNVNRGANNNHAFLKSVKHEDVVFTAEPAVHTQGDARHCSSHPNFNVVSKVTKDSKITAYVRKGIMGASCMTKEDGTAAVVTIRRRTWSRDLTIFCG